MSDQTVSLLQLVKRKDADSSDINTVDFLSLPTELQYQGWNQGLPQPGSPSVDEVVTLVMNAGNADTLATALQGIDTKIKEIGWAQDPLNPIGVWLRAQLQGETGQRQAFILAAKRPTKGLAITHPLAYSHIVPDYNLGLTRMPAWENVLASTVGGIAVTIHGGTVPYTLAGDAHARVAQLKVGSTFSEDPVYNDAWFGVKSSRYGVDPANFVPVWNLDLGFMGFDTSTTADATALDGTKCVCTFATHTEMAYRVVVPVSAITANDLDQRGKYIALLRAKTTDASLVTNIRIGNGYLNSTNFNSFSWKPRVQISSANAGWSYHTLGTVHIPASSVFFNQPMTGCALSLQAEYVSGTGNLELDSLVLIPAEHYVHANAALQGFGLSLVDLYILTRPDGRYSAITVDANPRGSVFEIPSMDALTWSIPSGSGVIVCAASGASTSLAQTITPTFTIYPSYNSLRGSA